MESVKTLIDKAASKVGTRYKLAQVLNVPASTIYNWETGRKPCPAEDRARLAGVAGEDSLQELVRATIENAKGEVKRAQLEKLFGKISRTRVRFTPAEAQPTGNRNPESEEGRIDRQLAQA